MSTETEARILQLKECINIESANAFLKSETEKIISENGQRTLFPFCAGLIGHNPVIGYYVAQTPASETKESVFAELCKNLERKEDRAKYPNSVFWFNKDGQFIFEHDEKNDIFWCSYALVWSVFESKFGMKYIDIQSFTKGMVEKHFKCNGVTTDNDE